MGLKPLSRGAFNAALKRRSSTVMVSPEMVSPEMTNLEAASTVMASTEMASPEGMPSPGWLAD
jgi:hypothetical protein